MSENKNNSIKGYVSGYVISVALTLEAFYLAINHSLSGWDLVLVLLVLAVIQLGVQLFFFLDIGKEKRPRVKLIALLFGITVVLIVVFGSLWIINNLNYNHERLLSPEQTNQEIIDDELIER